MLTILDDKKLSEIEITPSSSCCRRLVFLVSLIVRRAMSRGHSTFSLSRDVNKARGSKAKAKAKAKAPSLKAKAKAKRPVSSTQGQAKAKAVSPQGQAKAKAKAVFPKASPRPRPQLDQANTFSVKHTSPYLHMFLLC